MRTPKLKPHVVVVIVDGKLESKPLYNQKGSQGVEAYHMEKNNGENCIENYALKPEGFA
ncbi:hypothetical protein ZHAS_00006410 [Anopheles sinensis]|uniref:Uncharacterized protein n=1 Tax=Anopheles sinensis TaxID=74873 RepID=A0A084VM91_ANOSI|nr:hypothetical protein ZHAS_00006410 [Anopheles sinensis]